MPKEGLNQLVSSLRRTVEAYRLDGLTDAELLERFRAGSDATAFEAIVRRHGERVLAACHKVLTAADVEDAFQATFLVLLRESHGIRKQQALGAWLYGVAHRVALQARSRAARRARAEARQTQSVAEAAPDLGWREACAILHQELDRLPDIYRLPLLLCYLEGKSRDEAAEQLGVRRDVLRGRLERGRDRLRTRLTRRGIGLSAGLLAVVAARAVTAAPPAEPLLRATVTAATTGRISARVSALLRGSWSALTLGQCKLLALGMLTVVFVSVATGLTRPATLQTAPSRQATPATKAVEPSKDNEKKTVEWTGRVVDPDGKPVSGARVTVVPFTGKEDGFAPVAAPDATGTDGRFRFKVPETKTLHVKYGIPVPALLVTAPGYYPAWIAGRSDPGGATVRLQREDAKIKGRVVNLEGQPIAGATIRVTHVLAPTADALDPWLAALKTRRKEGAETLEQAFFAGEMPADVLPGVTLKATTDAEGRFELAGYGKERVLKAVVEGPTVTSREVRFVSRAIDTVQLPTYGRPEMPGATPYYGTNGTHAADPTRPVRRRGPRRDDAQAGCWRRYQELDDGASRQDRRPVLGRNQDRCGRPVHADRDAEGRGQLAPRHARRPAALRRPER